MVTGQYHYAMHCLTFPVVWGKIRQAKIRKIKTQISRKTHNKKIKIEHVCD